MRVAVIASSTVHVVVLAFLFAVGTGTPQIVPGPDVVQVSLLSPQSVSPPPSPPEKPAPEKPTETLKPTDETGVKLAPVKPVRKPAEPPEKREQEPATTVLPAAPMGPSGLRGEVAVESGNFEFTYYLVLVRTRVAENWSPPAGLVTRGQPVKAVVYFVIDREGEVTGTRLETASGAEFFDRSALRAVVLGSPMPPLPLGYAGADLGIHFGFEYASP